MPLISSRKQSFLKKVQTRSAELVVTKVVHSLAKLHYHPTYKEILAIKRSIEKFQFHVIVQHFLIETDMMSFSNMLKFTQKHLLRHINSDGKLILKLEF